MRGVPFIFRIRKSLSTKITVMNAGIILLIFISLILTTVSINYQLTLENEKQKMNVYISNTLSSIDNKLKDMGRVSLMTYSDERTQEILKNYDSFAYAEQLDNVEYQENIIKRVIGLPGDEIDLRNNGSGIYHLYINGTLVEEPYIAEPMQDKGDITYPFVVPEDCYFVMGDNRNASTDSRRQSIGAIEKEDIMGRVVLRLYPFSDIGMVK